MAASLHLVKPPRAASFRWNRADFLAAAAEALLLEFQVGGLHHLAVGLDVVVDLLAELIARPAAGIDRHRLELLAHAGVRERAPQLALELLRDRARRAGAHESAAPQADIDLGKPGLGHARYLRQLGRA